MTLKERLHRQIDELDDAALERLAEEAEKLGRQSAARKGVAERVALWRQLGDPADDLEPGAWAAFDREVERRPLFGARALELEPDD